MQMAADCLAGAPQGGDAVIPAKPVAAESPVLASGAAGMVAGMETVGLSSARRLAAADGRRSIRAARRQTASA